MHTENPAIRILSLDTVGLNPTDFIPFQPPIDCSYYLLKNIGPDAVFIRSIVDDPNTEDSLMPQFMETVTAEPPMQPWPRACRYQKDQTIYFIKATGPLIATFWR